MILKLRSIFLVYIVAAAAVISFSACEQKDEDAEKAVLDSTNVAGSHEADSIAMAEANKIPDLTGTWTGSLAGHSTTLNITKQDSTNVEGKITINYRNPVNQEIKGEFNFEEMTFTMSDQIKTRYQGNYSGKISEDSTKITGTFTQLVDNETANFTLTKK